jgi:Kef-type K+ transport system membrane component KefB
MGIDILLHLAIIIILSKIASAICNRFKQPPVIGMLLLGIVLGPTVLNAFKPGEIIQWIAQVGVLFLLFEAGLETNIKQIKKDSKKALLPALGGVLLPLTLGFFLTYFITHDLKEGLVVGVIFTATSVSVSVMTLLDLGKLKSIEGRCIINAAILDDIVGILLLTFVFGLSGGAEAGNSQLFLSVGKIVLFFAVTILAGIFLIKPFFLNVKKLLLENSTLALAVSIIFIYSWFAEKTGLAAITGAYCAGLFIGQTEYKQVIQTGIANTGRVFFIDIFFVSLGLEFNLLRINSAPLFLLLFVLLAISGKMIGSSIGAYLTKFDMNRSLRIGVGMVPRGEVALIIANMALERQLISTDIVSATVLMVIVSAMITPVLLKLMFKDEKKKTF